jgi:hypothetical protein
VRLVPVTQYFGPRRPRVAKASEVGLRFVPSEVEGLPGVTEVAVFPDRLELLSEGKWVVVRLLDIARWYRRGWLYRPLARLGWVRGWPSVADRMWYPRPGVSYFEFYTDPKIVVHVPYYPTDVGHMDTVFQRVKQVMAAGGYSTFDLG